MTTGSFYKMYTEEYSTTGATAKIQQTPDGYLAWSVDRGGVTVEGQEIIGDEGMNAALHRARVAVDNAAKAPLPNKPVEAVQPETAE
jgi:hypothetical protein